MWGQASAAKHAQTIVLKLEREKAIKEGRPPPPPLRGETSLRLSSSIVNSPKSPGLTSSRRRISSNSKGEGAAASIAATDVSSSTSSMDDLIRSESISYAPESKALSLLEAMKKASELQQERLAQIQEQIQELATRGKARLEYGNETGAILSIKAIKKLQLEERRVLLALDLTAEQEMGLTEEIDRARQMAVATKKPQQPQQEQVDDAPPRKNLWFKVDVTEYKDYVKEMNRVLTPKPNLAYDDGELLKELKAL